MASIAPTPPRKEHEVHTTPIDGELHAFLEAIAILGIDILPKTA